MQQQHQIGQEKRELLVEFVSRVRLDVARLDAFRARRAEFDLAKGLSVVVFDDDTYQQVTSFDDIGEVRQAVEKMRRDASFLVGVFSLEDTPRLCACVNTTQMDNRHKVQALVTSITAQPAGHTQRITPLVVATGTSNSALLFPTESITAVGLEQVQVADGTSLPASVYLAEVTIPDLTDVVTLCYNVASNLLGQDYLCHKTLQMNGRTLLLND